MINYKRKGPVREKWNEYTGTTFITERGVVGSKSERGRKVCVEFIVRRMFRKELEESALKRDDTSHYPEIDTGSSQEVRTISKNSYTE